MPLKLEKLNDIYNRPQYYAGYYCRNIPGNLGIKGSVSSESNHSSIISHFGDSGAWSIVYHMNKLMQRQQYFSGVDTKRSDNLFMTHFNYVSEYNGDLRAHDNNVCQYLSNYAYENFWYKTLN